MPRTIEEGFRDFHTRLTPTGGETAAATRHRTSIQQCIRANFGLNRFWRTGSFGNGTSVSGYSDVDYMADIPASAIKNNSSTSLTDLRTALDTKFPRTGVQTSCPAVVVPFGSDARETTEITPAFYAKQVKGHKVYGIPDCSGAWMSASPDAHNQYVRDVDNKLSNKVKHLVRFIKAWKYSQNVPISSFYLELRVAKYASTESAIVYSIDVKQVLSHLETVDLARIQDPMGVSGYIAPCRSAAALADAKSKLKTAATRARNAKAAEAAGRIPDAFEWWRKLFGERFPTYYK